MQIFYNPEEDIMGIMRSVIGTIGAGVKAVKTGLDKGVDYVIKAAEEAEKERAEKHKKREARKEVLLKKREAILRKVNNETKIAELKAIVAELDELDDSEEDVPATKSTAKKQQ